MEFRKLSEVVEINSGIALPEIFKNGFDDGGDIDFFKVAQMNNHEKFMINAEIKVNRDTAKKHKIKIFPKGSVLIPKRGGAIFTNKKRILKSEASYDSNIMGLKANNKIVSDDFLFLFLKSIDLKDFVDESSIPQINNKHIDRMLIPVISLSEQISIVSKIEVLFTSLDTAIKLVEENIEHTKHLLPAALNEIFEKAVSTYEVVPLMQYVDFVGGSQPEKKDFSYTLIDGFVRLIQIRDYKSNDHLVYINEKSTTRFCEVDDIMIGRYGPPVFQILRGLKGAYNVALMKAVPDEKYLSKDYLFWFLKNPAIQNYIIGISQRSAGQSGVNKDALEKYNIPIPKIETQQKIVNHLNQLSEKQQALQQQYTAKLKHLKALKASLLSAAFKGQL